MLGSILLSRGGLLYPEAHAFIPHYLSDRSLAEKIFDPRGTDFGMYQARELSYFFDYVDCRFIAACVRSNLPHFLSLSHYGFACLTAVLLWHFARRQVRLPSPLAGLVVLLFLSSPMVMLGGSFFRSSKIGCAASLLAVVICLGALWSSARHRPSSLLLLALSFALLAMGTFDRQGFFFALVVCMLQAGRVIVIRRTGEFVVLTVCLGVTAMLMAYDFWWAPYFIRHFNGYAPSLEFQRMHLFDIIHDSQAALRLFFYGPQLAFKYAGLLLGGMSWPLVAAAATALVWRFGPAWRWPANDSAHSRNWIKRLWWMAALLSLSGMTALMSLHLSPVLLPELCIVYYGLPCAAAVAVFLALALGALRQSSFRHWSLVVIGVLLLANILSLPSHRAVMRQGYFQWTYDNSPSLLQTIRNDAKFVPVAESQSVEMSGQSEQALETVRYLRGLK